MKFTLNDKFGKPLHTVDIPDDSGKEHRTAVRAAALAVLAGGGSLAGADLSGGLLSGLDLSDVDFSGCDISGSVFVGSNMNGADMTSAISVATNFKSSDLSEVDICKMKLRGIFMDSAIGVVKTPPVNGVETISYTKGGVPKVVVVDSKNPQKIDSTDAIKGT